MTIQDFVTDAIIEKLELAYKEQFSIMGHLQLF